MKKLILTFLIFLGSIGLLIADGTGGQGSACGWVTITSTGVWTKTFNAGPIQEIYVVNYTTTPCYINWVSTTATSSNFHLVGKRESYYDTDAQAWASRIDGTSRTELIRSNEMGIKQSTAPVNIRVQWKYWK